MLSHQSNVSSPGAADSDNNSIGKRRIGQIRRIEILPRIPALEYPTPPLTLRYGLNSQTSLLGRFCLLNLLPGTAVCQVGFRSYRDLEGLAKYSTRFQRPNIS